jgi:hypothetical protein
MSVPTTSQVFPGVRFFNQNENNDTIANEINSELTPTEELEQPELNLLTGTITLVNGDLIIVGDGTLFRTQCQVGQLITALDGGGSPYLIGEVATITNDLEIILKAGGPSRISGTGLSFASTRSFVKPSANIYMMVPTLIIGNTFYVPTPKGLRVGYTDQVGALMDSGLVALSQYSESLVPNVEAALVPVDCYIDKITPVPEDRAVSNRFVQYNGVYPENYWYLITGAGNLLRNTSFQIYTDEVFDSFLVEDGVTEIALSLANTQDNSGGYF